MLALLGWQFYKFFRHSNVLQLCRGVVSDELWSERLRSVQPGAVPELCWINHVFSLRTWQIHRCLGFEQLCRLSGGLFPDERWGKCVRPVQLRLDFLVGLDILLRVHARQLRPGGWRDSVCAVRSGDVSERLRREYVLGVQPGLLPARQLVDSMRDLRWGYLHVASG